MWALALAAAGFVTLIAGFTVPLPKVLDETPIVGPLHHLGGLWAATTEGAATIIAVLIVLGGVTLVYRAVAAIYGTVALAQFFAQVENIENMRETTVWALVALVMISAVQTALYGFQSPV